MSEKSYHNPVGNPCIKCGIPSFRHRVDHHFIPHVKDDFFCQKCCLPLKNHRERFRDNTPSKDRNITYIGIDGEGQGRKIHNYNFLAASTESGDREWYVEARKGERLTTEECLEMILELPTARSKIFSFAFNYDITKMLTDLDDKSLYLLFRPELRGRNSKNSFLGPVPVEWQDYELNLQGTKFVVKKGTKRVVIWDLFKFFQAKFVQSLRDWKVGSETLHTRMELMKNKRHEFDKENMNAVKDYCLEETRCIAQLAHKLIDAHEGAGLKLRSYYGAGSSGAAMLTAMNIKTKLAPTPIAMKEAVASAFAGGRFENSVIGTVRESLEGWDISSAYVYQLAFLPCLEHGSWTHTKKRKDLENAQAQNGALVRYTLGKNPGYESWGPFPFRTKDGSISFPIESGGGWVWLDEFIAGERIFRHVQFREAWVYSSNCNCKPFGQIPEYYNLRLKIGKEGPGIVIKLGMNSCYGKLAQSVGNALFQSWIWAGMITSGCRAQILHMLGLHKDMSNLLMVATDGILTRERLTPPEPLPTRTGDSGKPLGGWEKKPSDKGMFIARPGIYFPLSPSDEEIGTVRARGVGRSVVLEHWQKIIDAWEKDGVKATAKVPNVSRFCGGKTSISISGNGTRFKRAKGAEGKPSYGQWISRKVELSFDPLPKRERVRKDGVTLELRRFPKDLRSAPYNRAVALKTAEAVELRAAMQEILEQPESDLTDYE